MIKKTCLVAFALFLCQIAYSQGFRVAYVDSEYILGQIPEYQEAKRTLEQLAQNWREQLNTLKDELVEMEKTYQADKVFLTASLREKREADIKLKQETLALFQQQKFAPEGDLYQKQEEITSPLYKKMYDVFEKMIQDEKYQFIFDVSKPSCLLLADPKINKSDYVLTKMGYRKLK
jgi:outer membrane protein